MMATKARLWSRLDISNMLQVSLFPTTPRWDHLVAGKQALGLPLILHYDELYNYFTMYHNVITTEAKITQYM